MIRSGGAVPTGSAGFQPALERATRYGIIAASTITKPCVATDHRKRPRMIGQITSDVVYERLAPKVLDELRRKNPVMPHGTRKNKHFQWFTPDYGHPRLKEHLAAVTALLRAAPNWNAFHRSLERAFPKLNETIPLPFDEG